MKKFLFILLAFLATIYTIDAQRIVKGRITDKNGDPVIGANVVAKGTNLGTITDVDGNYSLSVPAGVSTLVMSYTGYNSQEISLGASNMVDVAMEEGVQLSETVVTAFGIQRYKNEVGYSAQKVEGDELTKTRDNNIVNSLSGKVAGLNVKRNNSMGGSTNIVLRGNKSLTGDNQALFVIDGVPVDNSNTNTTNQRTGRAGYDYGNAASDINPDDVESVTVLKGAAASALYGSRAANGVVMITTKKGKKVDGLGITVNTGINFGTYDKSTFAEYQDKYGAGYGLYYEDPTGRFLYRDINGDGKEDLVATTSEDASHGAKFDPNLLVYQWDAFDPLSPNYGKARPWVAAKNGPGSFFETSVGSSHGISIDKNFGAGYFKLGYNRNDEKGILPNSSLTKDLVNFGAGFDLTKSLQAFANINYTNVTGKGRYGTGYDSKNLMTNFRQWWQTNVDIKDQEDAYLRNKQNVTWNWADPDALVPIYWDNPYWTRHENFSNDNRGRYFGNVGLNYKILSWLNLKGSISLDKYNEYQEERIAVGSVDVSEYQRFDRDYQEYNYDLLAYTNSLNITDRLKFNALLGSNVRKQTIASIRQKTNSGLATPRLYTLSNSLNPLLAPDETLRELQVNGIFGSTSFIFDNYLSLDLSMRRDQASSLPKENNSYFYPAAALGLVFTDDKLLGSGKILSFGKVRLNYAEVGNTAPPLSVVDAYRLGVSTILDRTIPSTSFDGVPISSISTTKNNENLKPERTKSYEAGLEMRFMDNRLGFDVTYYKMNTIDQIIPAAVSRSTGYSSKYINAGDVENKGIELSLFLRPVTTKNFDWRIDLNWARNRNKVLDLGDIDNLQLGSFQGGVSINAALNEAYGTIRGNNFVYKDGKKVVGANGLYKLSATSNEVIGNINPDWTAGITNTFRIGNFTVGGLIDIKQGGDLFSLDLYYGLATGLYPETAGTNDNGKEVRSPNADGGGIILDGVKDDGTVNTTRVSAVNYGIYGYRRNPAAAFIYDASFVKLREVNIGYDFPAKCLGSNKYVKGINVGLYGRNLWIISKNLPYADPEEGLSSGNIQGHQGGAYPSVKVIGVNLNLKF